jgi:MFS family permease
MRAGSVLMTLGMVVVAVSASGPLIGVGVALLGAGLGFGMPGVMSAPTLLAEKKEQASVAGLFNASVAVTFMIGPLLGNGLYELGIAVPYVFGAIMLAGLVVFTHVHHGVRQTARKSPAAPAVTSGETEQSEVS